MVLAHRRRHLFLGEPYAQLRKVERPIYINHPDRGQSPTMRATDPPTISQPASNPHRVPQRTCSLTAELLRRVFAQDVLPCACGGRRTVVAFVADANLTRSLLTSLGLHAEPVTCASTRASWPTACGRQRRRPGRAGAGPSSHT